jgi:hypothetical protein
MVESDLDADVLRNTKGLVEGLKRVQPMHFPYWMKAAIFQWIKNSSVVDIRTLPYSL